MTTDTIKTEMVQGGRVAQSTTTISDNLQQLIGGIIDDKSRKQRKM